MNAYPMFYACLAHQQLEIAEYLPTRGDESYSGSRDALAPSDAGRPDAHRAVMDSEVPVPA